MCKRGYAAQIQHRQSRKLQTNLQHSLHFWLKVNKLLVYIKFYDQANNCGRCMDGFYHIMINHKDSHIPSPLIMCTCIALRNCLLGWQMNKHVHLKTSNSKWKEDWPDCSDCVNYKNDSCKITCCCTATGRKLLTSPGVADMNTFLINIWTTIPDSYQQRVYKNTLTTVKRQIEQVENPTPAMVICV